MTAAQYGWGLHEAQPKIRFPNGNPPDFWLALTLDAFSNLNCPHRHMVGTSIKHLKQKHMNTKVERTGIIGRDSICKVYFNEMTEYRFILMHGDPRQCLICEMWLDEFDRQWLHKLSKDREVAITGYIKHRSNSSVPYLEATEITIIKRGMYDMP